LGGWRVLCLFVAVFSLVATIAGGVYARFRIADRLAQAENCRAALDDLRLVIDNNLSTPEEVLKRYREIRLHNHRILV
jgi:hypothetical protein